MRKVLTPAAGLALAVWLLFAATPRYQTGQIVSNVTPAQNTTTGVLTLPDTPRNGSVKLYVNGVRQKPVEDFTAAGATLTPVAANVDLYRDSTGVIVADYEK